MITPRLRLQDRLPEIYRIKDSELTPIGQFDAFVGIIDDVLAALHDRVSEQYYDLFIEHCADWLIPYFADLIGTSHLSGDPATLRADVARTVFHRRRKGTLGAVESQVFALSRWAVHVVEMRERLAWTQHLNHQRPDAGGRPPLPLRTDIFAPVRGGMATLRDPATLSFIDTPFDEFAHVVDVKPPGSGSNLPNLGVFLWRLADYQAPVSQPAMPRNVPQIAAAPAGSTASFLVRFELHPMADAMVLFNTHRYHADADPPNLSTPDTVPNPMPVARLSDARVTGRRAEYVTVDTYAGTRPADPVNPVGLVLHVPRAAFPNAPWTFRGANLCAWELALEPPIARDEIVIDPEHGRVVFGVADAVQANQARPLADQLRVSATYGFAGPTGAHPVSRDQLPPMWPDGVAYDLVRLSYFNNPLALQTALDNLPARIRPLVIEITDSMTHDLDLGAIAGHGNDAGVLSLRLATSLWIRAASGHRPVIRLRQPLRFRPSQLVGPGAVDVEGLEVRLEGLYVTRQAAFGPADALIMQAAVSELHLNGCTLDPGGALVLDGSLVGGRSAIREGLRLDGRYGLAGVELRAFAQVPNIILEHTIAGPLAIDAEYTLRLTRSIVDAGAGVGATMPTLAVCAATGDPEVAWGPELVVEGMTAFGRVRVEGAGGAGGIWVHRLEVHDNQDSHLLSLDRGRKGHCIRFSWFSGNGDRLPQHYGCVFGPDARLEFTSEWFGRPGYAQLALASDRRIREEGPQSDEMGAFGYLLNSHKWKNINIRLRELMPVGVRALLIPVT